MLFPSIFGPSGALSSFFLSPEKLLFALAFLIPLILLYLIRPKPVNVAVPSLMFIFKDMGKSNINRFFRSLFRDILFLIQCLAIILLAIALAKPFIDVERESLVQQAILIIDDSASTGTGDRFDDIQDTAIAALSKENIIILSHENPQALDISGEYSLSAGDAKDLIEDLKPTHMHGDLPTALDLATQYAGPDSKVTIVSDMVFSRFENPTLIGAKLKVLRSKGALVEIIPVDATGQNIGIVDGQITPQNASVTLKIQNFNDKPEDFGIELNGKALSLPQNVLAPRGQPGSLITITAPLGHGTNEFTLTPKDDFMVDNSYYVSIPDKDLVRVLLITNDQTVQQSRLIPALTAAGDQFTKVEVQYGTPPKVPDLEHEMYILKDISTQFILPGVINDLEEKASEGAIVVVYAQPGLFGIDLSKILPVTPKPEATPLGGKQEVIVNNSLALMRGLSDIGQVNGDQLLRVKERSDAIVYAYITTNDGPEPVIAARRIGNGAVIYYGIRDQRAIDLDPQSYAVVWGRIVDYSLTDPATINVPTGTVLTSTNGRVKTPVGTVDSPTIATHNGIYTAGRSILAANLYSLRPATSAGETDIGSATTESAISTPVSIEVNEASTSDAGEDGEAQTAKVPKDLSTMVIIIGLAVMFFELVYIKYRGDL